MPAPPEIWQFFPIWAQEPTVAQVSIMVASSTLAPTLTKEGISTTFFAINAEWRTIAPGTARNPAARNRFSLQPLNLESTLSHHEAPPGAPSIIPMSLRRKESSTAFFSHWCTRHSPSCFCATRSCPESSASRAASTAWRGFPMLVEERVSRVSQARSIRSSNSLSSIRNANPFMNTAKMMPEHAGEVWGWQVAAPPASWLKEVLSSSMRKPLHSRRRALAIGGKLLGFLRRLLKTKELPEKLSYEQARSVLEVRKQQLEEELAERADAEPEMLYFL